MQANGATGTVVRVIEPGGSLIRSATWNVGALSEGRGPAMAVRGGIVAAFLEDQIARGQCCYRELEIEEETPLDQLVPDGFEVRCRFADTKGKPLAVYARDWRGGMLLTGRWAWFSARAALDADALVESVRARVVLSPRETNPPTTFALWSDSEFPDSDKVTIPRVDWPSLRRNYPGRLSAELDALMALREPEMGRLILWFGPTGTGKTTALRALMNAWEPWCETQYVTDPDRLFDSSHYMSRILEDDLLSDTHTRLRRRFPDREWRLIVVEDADDILRETARFEHGAGFARLLNATDGILGLASKAIILLTTNEDIRRIDPALTRPGRRLASMEFPKFTPAQAQDWLGPDSEAPTRAVSLAELYETQRAATSDASSNASPAASPNANSNASPGAAPETTVGLGAAMAPSRHLGFGA